MCSAMGNLLQMGYIWPVEWFQPVRARSIFFESNAGRHVKETILACCGPNLACSFHITIYQVQVTLIVDL